MNRSLVKQQHIPRLSRQELRTVRQTWPCFKLKQSDLVWLRKYKQDHGFDPYFLGEYQIYKVFEKTNLPLRLSALENKALFDIYLSKLPFPQTYIRCISNVFYDSAMAVISIDKAVDVLTNVKEFIIKPACETSQGKGMKKICTIDYDKDKLLDLLSSYRDSYARIGGGILYKLL